MEFSPGPMSGNVESFPTMMGGAKPIGTAGSNPFLPVMPTGTNAPPLTFNGGERKNAIGGEIQPPTGTTGGGSPGSFNTTFPTTPAPSGAPNFPANTGGMAAVPPGTGFPPVGGFGGVGGLGTIPGMSSQATQLLYQFLASGAGFNPQVAQALIAALQPQVQRGEEDLMEQFSTAGARNSSSAQVGLGDYLSQVNLNEGQIFAQMYETSVQDYLSALGLTKTQPQPSGLGALIGGIGSLAGGIGSIWNASQGGNSPTINLPPAPTSPGDNGHGGGGAPSDGGGGDSGPVVF